MANANPNKRPGTLLAFESFCNKKTLSDVQFMFPDESTIIYGHKVFLAARSEVFATMFTSDPEGNFTDTNQQVKITDIDPAIFELVMKFIYADFWDVDQLSVEIVLQIACAADKYMIDELLSKCAAYLLASISTNPTNVLLMGRYVPALESNVDFKTRYRATIEQNIEVITNSPLFLVIEENQLLEIVQCDSLAIKEVDLFKAVLLWAKERCKKDELVANAQNLRKVLRKIIHSIRFPTLTIQEFTKDVVPERILKKEEELWIYRAIGNGGVPITFEDDDGDSEKFITTKRSLKPLPVNCPECCRKLAGSSCNFAQRYCSSTGGHYQYKY